MDGWSVALTPDGLVPILGLGETIIRWGRSMYIE